MLGGILAVLAAATFGFNNAAIRRGVLSGSMFQGLAITVPMGVPMFLIGCLVSGSLHHLADFPGASYFWLSAAGLSHFVWGRYCNYRATRAIGGNLAGPWQQSQLILALVLAILVLGETLTVLKMAGIVLVILGGFVTSRGKHEEKPKASDSKDSADKPKKKPDFVPNYAEGYTFALLSATGYGLSPVLIRLGLQSRGPGFSMAGGLISYGAATIVVAIMLTLASKWRHAAEVAPEPAKWFAFGGFLVGTSQMLRYAALSLVPVTVVAPIQSTSAVFRTIFGWLINREHEVFGMWVYLGMALSVAGAVALTVSTQFVLTHIALPEYLLHIMQWHWPS